MGELYRWKESRDVPDTLNAVLEYPEGFTVTLGSSFNNQFTAESGFQILGTQGTLTIDDGVTFYPEKPVENNSWIVESWPKALEEAYYQDPKVIATEVEPRKNYKKPEPEHFKDESNQDSTIPHFGHFFESIRTRKPYVEDAAAGHHAAACAHLINLSARERRMTEWDFSRDDIRS
jgi:predicted dehydrogenase